VDYPRFLLRMTELELLDRERRAPNAASIKPVSGGQEPGHFEFRPFRR